MIRFSATIKRFASQGEKTGWTYVEIPGALAKKLHEGDRKAFRGKGKEDGHEFSMVNLFPMGGGDFIMVLNATVRKAIRKQKGDTVKITMACDHGVRQPPPEVMEGLSHEPECLETFQQIH